MNTNAQIQLHFPRPGNWGQFLLTALWQDAAGYSCRREYHPQELPEELRPLLQQVVASLVGLDAPWQATHVVASLSSTEAEEGGEAEEGSANESSTEAVPAATASVELELHARRADGASRSFSPADYPQLRLADAAALTAFRRLTGAEA